MTAAMIVQLVIALGPTAFQLIGDLMAVWHKPVLSLDEVKAICDKAQKSYDAYEAEDAAAAAAVPVKLPGAP